MKDEECVYYLDSSKCDSDDCHGCVARLKENKGKYHDKEIRAKAIDEFAEACKNHIFCQTFGLHPKTIDEIAREMKGE